MPSQSPVGLGLPAAARQEALAGGLDAAAVDALIAAVLPGFATANVQMGVTRYSLTVAERQNWIAAPIQLLPAEAGVLLVPLVLYHVRTTGAAASAGTDSASVRWTGIAFNLTSTFPGCSGAINRNDFDLVFGGGTLNVPLAAPATAVGQALNVQGLTNQVGGAGSMFEGWLFFARLRP